MVTTSTQMPSSRATIAKLASMEFRMVMNKLLIVVDVANHVKLDVQTLNHIILILQLSLAPNNV